MLKGKDTILGLLTVSSRSTLGANSLLIVVTQAGGVLPERNEQGHKWDSVRDKGYSVGCGGEHLSPSLLPLPLVSLLHSSSLE